MRKWVMWFPVLMVGSMVYWTLAFSFGGLSLMSIAGFRDPDALDVDGASLKDGYQSITVNLSGASDPEEQQAGGTEQDPPAGDDVPGSEANPGSVTVDLVSDHGSGLEFGHQPAEHPILRSPQDDGLGQGDRGGSARPDRGPGDTAF